MELYFSPFACSLAAHMVAREAEIEIELRQVKLKSKLLNDGTDFQSISPKGQVPALILENGQVLTESVAVLPYLASLKPEAGLMPEQGSPEYFQVLEWLSYISTEMHKRIFYPIFWLDEHHAQKALEAAPERLEHVAKAIENKTYLVGNRYCVADAFLCWWLILAPRAGIDLKPYPNLLEYKHRCAGREKSAAAIAYEKKLLD